MLYSARLLKEKLTPTIFGQLEKYPGYGFVVCGHSLGAGVTALFTLLFNTEHPEVPIHGYAFASPAVMSANLSVACTSLITTSVLGDDLVPRISFGSIEDLKQTMHHFLARTGTNRARLLQIVKHHMVWWYCRSHKEREAACVHVCTGISNNDVADRSDAAGGGRCFRAWAREQPSSSARYSSAPRVISNKCSQRQKRWWWFNKRRHACIQVARSTTFSRTHAKKWRSSCRPTITLVTLSYRPPCLKIICHTTTRRRSRPSCAPKNAKHDNLPNCHRLYHHIYGLRHHWESRYANIDQACAHKHTTHTKRA
jgi:pimeloyl-ACP methyl ester carboxylesterase